MRELRALILSMILMSASPVLAAAPLPGEVVADALRAAEKLPASQALWRFLALLNHLDALSPDEVLARLGALSEGTSLMASRARLELAALIGTGVPPSILTSALAVAELAPDGDAADIATLHRRLVRGGSAEVGRPFDPDDPDRLWSEAGQGPIGAVALDSLVPGPGRVALHVVLPIEVATSAAGILRVGATGDIAVSLADASGGEFFGTALALEHAVPDQLAIPLKLAPGRHVVLVTLRPNAGEPALLRVRFDASVALRASSSAHLDWGSFEVPAAAPALAWNEDVRRIVGRQPSLEGLVLARLMGLPDLTETRKPTTADARAQAASLEDRLASATLPAGDLLLMLGAVRRPEDRASLLLGHLDARDPLLLLALAEHTAERGQLVQAGALVDEAARAPRLDLREAIVFTRARLARLAHSPEEVLIAYDVAAPDLAPDDAARRLASRSERTCLEVARAALDLGRADLALAVVSGLAEPYPGRLDLGLNRARAALAARNGDLGARLARALAEQRPDRPTLALDAASKLLARDGEGDRPAARALVARAMERLAWKPDALVDAGRLLEALGDRAAATAAYARALEVSPAHEDARRDLERLQGAEPSPLTLTVDDVVRAPVVDADASFEVLGEEHFVKVRLDGSATHWTRRILRAQAVPEAREARTLIIRFDPTQESVRVLDATVRHAATGPVSSKTLAEPIPERLLQSIAEDWYGLYYDLRQLAVPFDHVRRGDIIEVTWRIDPVGQLFPGVVDIFEVLLDRVPKHLHRTIVETPPGLALKTRLAVPDGMNIKAKESALALPDGGVRHTMEVTELSGLPLEALAPGTAEVSPVWQATTFRSWREVATWYRRLVEPQKVLTPAMKAFVAEVTSKKATPGEILSRLVDYVTREIRYVGLEFGIHGYKPYRADQIWSRRFGDCKDKATLLSALLAEAGLDGEVTLLRTRKQGRLSGALPSLSLFDHAVLYLRGRDELVDPTATYFGLGELPKEDQGAQVLVLTPPEEPAELALSRVDPPARNGVTGTYSVTLEQRGGAGIQATVAFLGTQAPAYRALLLDPASQKLKLAELMNRRFPGLSLRDFRISDPGDRSRPFELVFRAEVPRFGQLQSEADGTLFVTRPTGIDGHRQRYAGEEHRRLPLVLGPPMRWDVTYRYILPDGHRARELPKGGEAAGPYGSYRVTWLDEGPVVTVRAELTYLVDQVGVADYVGLRDFVRGFDAVVAAPLVLAKVVPGVTTPTAHSEVPR